MKGTLIRSLLLYCVLFALCCFSVLSPSSHTVSWNEFRQAIANMPVDKGEYGKRMGRDEFDYIRYQDPYTNEIPRHIRAAELRMAESLPVRSASPKQGERQILTQDWSARGPYNIGGRTRTVKVDITDSDRILTGGVTGGIWLSEDGGDTWIRCSDDDQIHDVSCIIQDTREGHTDTWYCATGETYGSGFHGVNGYQCGSMLMGEGVFKSEDGGLTWTHMESTGSPTTEFNGPFDIVHRMIINHTNEEQDELIAATWSTIHRSVDGGETWETVLGSFNPNQNFINAWTEVAITPDGTMYAVIASGNADAGFWRSTNGVDWVEITPENWPNNYTRVVIGVAPSTNDYVYYYGMTPGAGFQGQDGGISFFRLTRVGELDFWENLSNNMPNLGSQYPGPWGNQIQTFNGYCMLLAIHPDDPNTVFLGGTSLYRSFNGFGSTTSTEWIGGYYPYFNGVLDPAHPVNFNYPGHHADVHDICFDPQDSDVMYCVSDGGISKTLDCLMEPTQENLYPWEYLVGYITTQFYYIAVNPVDEGNVEIIGGMQDNSTFLTGSPDSDAYWIAMLGGDGLACDIGLAEMDSWRSYYASIQYGSYIARIALNETYELMDWEVVTPPGNFSLWLTPFRLDPTNWRTLYVADQYSVWRNLDVPGDEIWTILDETSGNSGYISAINAAEDTDGMVYYARCFPYSGQAPDLYRINNSRSDEYSVTALNSAPFIRSTWIHCIAIDPTDSDKIAVAITNYNVPSIYYSEDGGETWTNVSGNLEENPTGEGTGPAVNWIEIVYDEGVPLYLAGTSVGLFSTTSLETPGVEWQQEGADIIGRMRIACMDSRNSDGFLAIGTHGAGTYSCFVEVSDDVQQDNPGTLPETVVLEAAYPNPFNATTNIPITLPQRADVTLKVYNSLGREVATLVDRTLESGSHLFRFTADNHASGAYFVRATVDGVRTMNQRIVLVK